MIKLAGLLLAMVATYVAALDWNDRFEHVLELYNQGLRKGGSTAFSMNGGRFNQEIETGTFVVLGLDSLMRTGQCTVLHEGKRTTFDHHFGLRMLVATFPSLTVRGQQMSAYTRIRNNSIHFKFTVIKDGKCRVTVDEFKVEELNNVEFGSSMTQFDGLKIDQPTTDAIRSTINTQLLQFKEHFGQQLTTNICHNQAPHESFLQIFLSTIRN